MKKTIALLLTVLLVFSCVPMAFAANGSLLKKDGSSYGAYKHVFILGVDGAGNYFQKADTPNFDRIFKDGAVTNTARAEVYTDSAPNWGSILTGVSFLRNLYTNGNISPEGDEPPKIQHMRKYPTVYNRIRCAMPDAVLASFGNWSAINYGIVEDDLDIYKHNDPTDEEVAESIVNYLDEGNKPTLLFTQFDSVDGAGHAHGSDSEIYINQISIVDEYIGWIYDAIERNGLLDDSLIIVLPDHGHKAEGGHGRFSYRESVITLAVAGKTVKKGGTMDKDTRNRDVTAIALFALGIPKPLDITARVPANLFNDYIGEVRPIHRDILDAIVSGVMWIYTLTTKDK